MASNAKDAGSGAVVIGVSEKWCITSDNIASPVAERLSVTLRLVPAEKVVLSPIGPEAESDLPFESISVTAKLAPPPTICSDAPVMGSLDGAVIVNEMVPMLSETKSPNMKWRPGLFASVSGRTSVKPGSTAPETDIPEMVLSFTVQLKPGVRYPESSASAGAVGHGVARAENAAPEIAAATPTIASLALIGLDPFETPTMRNCAFIA